MKNPLTKDERHAIQRTIHKLEIIQSELDQIIEGSQQEALWKAYGRFGFDQLLGNGNPHDASLFDLMTIKK